MSLAATVYAPPRAKSPWRVETHYFAAAVRHYGHARQALVQALKISGVSGGHVLLPQFVCRDLLASVATAGAKPLFYGISPALTPSEDSARWPDARAVLIIDYFGWPQELSPFTAYAQRTGSMIIEDAAHALFSRDGAGRLLGTRAPLGLLSLRKSLSLPNGGSLLANDPVVAAKMPTQLPFESAPGRRHALKSALRPFLGFCGAPAAHIALNALRACKGETPQASDSESVLPMPEAPCSQLERPIVCADPSLESARRRSLWLHCDRVARENNLEPLFPSLPDGVVPYAYAFRAGNFTRGENVFAHEGLRVLPWPDLPKAVVTDAPIHYRNVSLVHFLW